MSCANPNANSKRTMLRATALAWARGCEDENPCWALCLETAVDAILEDNLDEWELTMATTSAYWKYTNLSGSSYAWDSLLAVRKSKA